MLIRHGYIAEYNDITTSLTHIIEGLKKIKVIKIPSLDAAEKLLGEVRKFQLTDQFANETVDYERCECGMTMTTFLDVSELICEECNLVRRISGTIIREEQLYSADGLKLKNNSYDPTRHYYFWVERIQGIETRNIAEEDYEKLSYAFKRDRVNLKLLTITIMRKYLKDCGLTTYNVNAVSLIKHFSGISPPRLTYAENRDITAYFNKVLEIYDTLSKSEEKNNRPYYPYFIFKIMEYYFVGSEKLKLLNGIHLQSEQTVAKDDIIWEKICKHNGFELGIPYVNTNYIKYMLLR